MNPRGIIIILLGAGLVAYSGILPWNALSINAITTGEAMITDAPAQVAAGESFQVDAKARLYQAHSDDGGTYGIKAYPRGSSSWNWSGEKDVSVSGADWASFSMTVTAFADEHGQTLRLAGDMPTRYGAYVLESSNEVEIDVGSNPEYYLYVSTLGEGTVTVTPDQDSYSQGASVTMEATPAEGWEFDHWGEDITGASATKSITMTQNVTAYAYFVSENSERHGLMVSISGPSELVAGEEGGWQADVQTSLPIQYYDWSFGDGESAEGSNVTHVYGDVGEYEINLQVIAEDGSLGTASKTVTVTPAPVDDTMRYLSIIGAIIIALGALSFLGLRLIPI